MFAIALLCGLIYCTYDTNRQDASWLSVTTILTSTAIFFKLYLSYRKAVKRGTFVGKLTHSYEFLILEISAFSQPS